MAQLVEQLLPIPEVRGSNPAIGKFYLEILFTINSIEKTKINKKEARNGPLLKTKTSAVAKLAHLPPLPLQQTTIFNEKQTFNGPPRLSICHQRAVHKRKKS